MNAERDAVAPAAALPYVPPLPYWQLSSFYFFYFALLGAWLPFWPLYLKDIGYGATAIGVLVGVMQGTKIIAPHVWGWLADRSGVRMHVVRSGAVAATLIFSLIFFRSNFVALIMIIAGYSFFWNAVLSQFEVVTLAHLRSSFQRYSLVRVWGSIGFIAAVGGLGFLFDVVSLRRLPFILWLLLAGIAISSFLVAEPARTALAVSTTRGSLWAILRRPVVWAFLGSCFLLQVAHGPYYTFFSVYLESHGYQRSQTGLLWSLGVIAEVVLFLNMHRVYARFSLRTILLASFLLAAVRWLIIALYVDTLPLLLFAQCLHAATFASYHAVAVELVRRLFAGGYEGQGMALYSGVCFGGGAAVGAVGSGLVWSISPVATLVGAAAVSLLAWLIGWLWIYPPLATINSELV